MKVFSTKLHAILVSITEGDAFRIVDSARDCNGLESYRLLTKRYEPKNPGTKRALLKSIINNPGAKKIIDIEANLMNVERLILKYESMTDAKNHLPEDLKAMIIIELCHRDLREHLELITDQMSYTKVRTEILNYVERKRDTINNDIKAMVVDHFDSDYHYADWDWWEDDAEYEQLNYFQKGGKGGQGGKGKGYYSRLRGRQNQSWLKKHQTKHLIWIPVFFCFVQNGLLWGVKWLLYYMCCRLYWSMRIDVSRHMDSL
jgi:hypothetical protein